jgi:DNA-binding PadR family transcriptional regulator
MIEPFRSTFLTPTKKYRRLSILLSIQDASAMSQHKMGGVTHLSSSMVNNYIKKLQKEGLISVTGETNRTQRYHLTPLGRDMLMSLFLSYSSEIIQLYGGAKRHLAERLLGAYENGIRKVALFGAADTAEVVFAAIKETPLAVTGVVDSDPGKQGKFFNGFPIKAPEYLRKNQTDAVIITSFGRQQEIYEHVQRIVGDETSVIRLSSL